MPGTTHPIVTCRHAVTHPVTSSIASYPSLSRRMELSVRSTLVPVTGSLASSASRDSGVIFTDGNRLSRMHV